MTTGKFGQSRLPSSINTRLPMPNAAALMLKGKVPPDDAIEKSEASEPSNPSSVGT